MTWFLTRQHRVSAGVTVALLAALALLLATTGSQIWARYTAMLTCTSDCLIANQLDVLRGYDTVVVLVHLTIAIPVLVGIWGATVLAREFEAGTHVLSWTQAQTRRGWIGAHLVLVLGLAVLCGAALGALVTWWSGPLNALRGDRFEPGKFDGQGLAPLAYTVFAVALGLAAGAVLRRVVPALAVTVAGFAALRLLVTLFLRQRFLAPLTITVPADRLDSVPFGSWVLGSQLQSGLSPASAQGQPLPSCSAQDLSCLAAHGYQYVVTFQPADRFWTFQLVEAGIFLGLAGALIAVTWLTVRHRDA